MYEFKEIVTKLLTSTDYECIDEVNDEISSLLFLHEKLEKENAKLREALESIANDDANEYDMVCEHYTDLKREAREVLKGE